MIHACTIPPALDTEIVSTRVFDARPEDIFGAFADPRLLAQWWGPDGFTNTFQTFDFRPGGDWIFTMHGPDGTNYPNESRFVEIAHPERIVFEHLRPMHWFHLTALLTPEENGTRLTWRMRFEAAEEVMKIGRIVTASNQQNFNRLEAALRVSTDSSKQSPPHPATIP